MARKAGRLPNRRRPFVAFDVEALARKVAAELFTPFPPEPPGQLEVASRREAGETWDPIGPDYGPRGERPRARVREARRRRSSNA